MVPQIGQTGVLIGKLPKLVSEDDNTVTVVRILFGKRNWIKLLKGATED